MNQEWISEQEDGFSNNVINAVSDELNAYRVPVLVITEKVNLMRRQLLEHGLSAVHPKDIKSYKSWKSLPREYAFWMYRVMRTISPEVIYSEKNEWMELNAIRFGIKTLYFVEKKQSNEEIMLDSSVFTSIERLTNAIFKERRAKNVTVKLMDTIYYSAYDPNYINTHPLLNNMKYSYNFEAFEQLVDQNQSNISRQFVMTCYKALGVERCDRFCGSLNYIGIPPDVIDVIDAPPMSGKSFIVSKNIKLNDGRHPIDGDDFIEWPKKAKWWMIYSYRVSVEKSIHKMVTSFKEGKKLINLKTGDYHDKTNSVLLMGLGNASYLADVKFVIDIKDYETFKRMRIEKNKSKEFPSGVPSTYFQYLQIKISDPTVLIGRIGKSIFQRVPKVPIGSRSLMDYPEKVGLPDINMICKLHKEAKLPLPTFIVRGALRPVVEDEFVRNNAYDYEKAKKFKVIRSFYGLSDIIEELKGSFTNIIKHGYRFIFGAFNNGRRIHSGVSNLDDMKGFAQINAEVGLNFARSKELLYKAREILYTPALLTDDETGVISRKGGRVKIEGKWFYYPPLEFFHENEFGSSSIINNLRNFGYGFFDPFLDRFSVIKIKPFLAEDRYIGQAHLAKWISTVFKKRGIDPSFFTKYRNEESKRWTTRVRLSGHFYNLLIVSHWMPVDIFRYLRHLSQYNEHNFVSDYEFHSDATFRFQHHIKEDYIAAYRAYDQFRLALYLESIWPKERIFEIIEKIKFIRRV